jgi:MFS family permease
MFIFYNFVVFLSNEYCFMSKKRHHKTEYFWIWLIVNSLCAFLTMFIALFFSYYVVQMFIARFFGIQSVLRFDDIQFVSAAEEWFPKLILVAYTSPIFFSIFASAFFYYLHFLMKRTPYLLRLYCLWGYVISLALFICSFIHGYFVYKGFAVVFMWYNVSKRWNDLLALLGVVGLCVGGLFLGISFLKLAPSQDLEMNKKPRHFLTFFVLVPLILGTAILWLFLMRNWQNSVPLLVVPSGIFLMMLFMIIRREPIEEKITIVKNLPTGQFSWVATAVCILVIIATRYLVIKGFKTHGQPQTIAFFQGKNPNQAQCLGGAKFFGNSEPRPCGGKCRKYFT